MERLNSRLGGLIPNESPGPNPPKYINVRVSSSATSTGGPVNDRQASGSGSADNGLGASSAPQRFGPVATSRKFETKDSSSGTVEMNLRLKATVQMTAKDGSISAGCSAAVLIINHAHPCNYRRLVGRTEADIENVPGELHFRYQWDSTSGITLSNLIPGFPEAGSDLGACYIREYVFILETGHIIALRHNSLPKALLSYRIVIRIRLHVRL